MHVRLRCTLSRISRSRSARRGPGLVCAQCAAPLMADQRYCVECGTRGTRCRRYVAKLIAALQPEEPGGTEARQRNCRSPTPGRLPDADSEGCRGRGHGAAGVRVVSRRDPQRARARRTSAGPVDPAGRTRDREVRTGRCGQPAAACSPAAHRSRRRPLPRQAPPDRPEQRRALRAFHRPAAGKARVHDRALRPRINQAFTPTSPAPYLATTLTSQGELLSNYYAVTQGELANEIALMSGQGPNKSDRCGLHDLHGRHTGNHRRDGTGSRGRLRLSVCHGDAPRAAHSRGQDVEGLRGGHRQRRRRRPADHLPSPRARSARQRA